MIAVSLGRTHFTNQGIKGNGTFSVNIPSVDMLRVTDHCGLVSGSKVDKSGLFRIFYGGLKTTHMITECPLSLERRKKVSERSTGFLSMLNSRWSRFGWPRKPTGVPIMGRN